MERAGPGLKIWGNCDPVHTGCQYRICYHGGRQPDHVWPTMHGVHVLKLTPILSTWKVQ